MEQLTPEQIAVLIQMIAAFRNGKRLNELPNIGNTNPFDLIVEVLDTSGESHQAKLAALLPYIEEQCAYGIEWDTTISSPLCTRIGNLSLHRGLPIQNRMKGCLLNDNGLVNEYLSPNNWLAHDRSGARGQVMVEIPAHYRKFETDGTKRRVMISEYPLPGYHFVKKQYTSSYEASWEWSTGKLCSVVNMSEDYRGGDNNAEWDNTYRSLLGRPVTQKTQAQFRTAARLRGAGTQWNMLVYNTYKAVVWLYLTEYANLNSQSLFNAQLDVNGYKQGGLGNGVTILPVDDAMQFNKKYPFIPCGYTDSLGNNSGEIPYDVDINGDGSKIAPVYANRFRGIENIFGHIFKFIDGFAGVSNEDNEFIKAYVSDNPANFANFNTNNYRFCGNIPYMEGFVKELMFGEYGEIVPVVFGGGSTVYFCDQFLTAYDNPNERYLWVGGDSTSGTSVGLFYFLNRFGGGNNSFVGGTRLCFIPE